MKNLLFIPLFVFGLFAVSQAQTTQAKLAESAMSFSAMEYDFKHIKQGESVTHEFSFKNTGKEPLIITDAKGSCGCTVPEYPKQPIAPGGEGTIKVTFNSTGKSGTQDKTVTITYNDGQVATLHMKGTVDIPTASPQNSSTAPTK